MRRMSIVCVTSALVALILNLGRQHEKAFKTLSVLFMSMVMSNHRAMVRKVTFRVTQTWILVPTCSLLVLACSFTILYHSPTQISLICKENGYLCFVGLLGFKHVRWLGQHSAWQIVTLSICQLLLSINIADIKQKSKM